MSRLSEQTASRDANLVIASPATPGAYVLITDNEDPVATGRTHVDGVMSVNPLLEQPLPRAITLDELMPNGAFLRSPLYLRFLKPLNIRYLLSRDVLRDEMLCAMLTLERNADQEPFSAKEKELLELITPHIRRAMRLREQHTQGSYLQRFFEEAMAKLSIACVLLDGHGRVFSMNHCARAVAGAARSSWACAATCCAARVALTASRWPRPSSWRWRRTATVAAPSAASGCSSRPARATGCSTSWSSR